MQPFENWSALKKLKYVKLLTLKVLVKKTLSHDDWKIRRRSERKIPKPINMYTDKVIILLKFKIK